MSTSTDGILFFGFTFFEEDSGEDFPECLTEADGWEAYFAAQHGCVREEEKEDSYKDYYERKKALETAEPCTIRMHGGEGCFAHFVAIKKSLVSASRGYPVNVTCLTEEPEWRKQLEDFCKLMNIPFQEPKWFLASLWM